MSGQGVRTHHRMAAEVNDPDNTSGQDMLSSGCNVHECRVLLPDGVWIGKRATCPLGGIRMELIWIAWRRGTFRIRNSVRRHFTAGWERRTFQLLRSDLFGSSDSAYQESFSLSIQCGGVLLKLPDISDRHLRIFCFRYLLSKSPKSPCNPPIIGFLSL